MKIADYEISVLETGFVSLDGGAMFGVVPKPLWSKSNPADDLNRIILAMRLLLIKSADRLMIVDTGVGKKMSEKLAQIYNVDHKKYDLESSLKQKNLAPEDITDVIVTHMHFDHIGGATYFDQSNNLQLTFPNATHHVQKKHWEWAMNPSEKDGASFMKENYVPIQDHGKLNLIDGPGELYPGIEMIVLNGHTPAMQAPKISDGLNTLFYCADLLPTATHIPLPYIMGYDVEPLKTLAEKKELLPKAVEENWTFLFEHDPYNLAGKVELGNKGFRLAQKVDL
ncbi:MAG: MBL fold metallo-hydrolase [Calditrichaeota bacterium]|nr:MAG: MBL fold metallo-hydrolase [Calditrichota bacterium]MBL1207052.1 MBL fold metallo-hydrolase [Calditrichota bacterium]NOG46881.1 MBL fold metallo-hydrolase [Calditrichota bacterium]